MKRYFYLFMLLIAFSLCNSVSRADVITNYAVNFDKSIATDDKSFKPAPGWGHIASYGSFGYGWMAEEVYPEYSWSADGGRGGSGALKVGTQTELTHPDYAGTTKTSTDLLVTPKLTGKASIYVKKATEKGTIKFYKVTISSYSGKFVTGSLYTTISIPELSEEEWVKVDLPETNDEYVGIYGSDVYFDDFSAASADVVLMKSMKITKLEMLNSTKPDIDAEGNLQYSFNVTLQNTGDVDFTPGDEKFSLSLVNYSNSNKVIDTKAIGEPLCVGEEKTLPFAGTIKSSDLLYMSSMTRARVDVKENISGTSEQGGWLEPVAYKSVMTIKNGSTTLKDGDSFAWGKVNAATEKVFTIGNDGAAPLNISAITLPEGFTTTLVAPLTIAAHEVKDMNITFCPTLTGDYNGNVTIAGEDVDALSFAVSGTMLDKNKFYVNFEDGKLPAGSYLESDDWKIVESGFTAEGNAYFLKNSKLGGDSHFVTPLLEIADGEMLTIDVAKAYYSSSSANCYLNVYYSDDRKEWTLARKIEASELSSIRSTATGHYEGQLNSIEISGIPAGKHYLGFGAGYTIIDNIYGFKLSPVAHDMKVSQTNIPETGMVNNLFKASVTLHNLNAVAEAADSYSATLYLKKNGSDEMPIEVAAKESPEIAPGEDLTLEFAFTPHEAAPYSVFAAIKANGDGYTLRTADYDTNISEELASKEIQMGEGTATSYNTPINWYSADNSLGGQSDILYKAAMLQKYGIKEGDKITSVTYRGTGANNKDVDFSSLSLNAYVGMVDGTSYTNKEDHDGLQHVSVFDKQAVSVKVGDDITTTIKFNDPIVWDGTSALRLFTEISSNGNRQYTKVNYPLDATYKTAGYKTGSASSFNNANTPIAFIGVETDPMTVSGTVSYGEKPVEGALISLTNGDVLYSGKSDSEGKFNISVIQTNKRYKLSVAADRFIPYEETDSVDVSKSVVKDIKLQKNKVKATGKVLFRNAGVAGATVTLACGELSYSTTTTDDGVYTFNAVEPNRAYNIKVDKEKFNVYSSAEPVEIDENTTLGDITMTKPDFNIYGKVVWGDTPVEGVLVQYDYVNEEGETWKMADYTKADGTYGFTGLDANYVYTLRVIDLNKEFEDLLDGVLVESGEDTEKNFSLTIKPITITVEKNGFMTYSYKRALDFSAIPYIKAYTLADVKNNYTELTEVNEVPANTGILLEVNAGTYELVPVETAAAVEKNLLVATTADYTITDDKVGKAWALTDNNGMSVFKSIVGTTIPKGGAYLDYESTRSIIYLNQTDGINRTMDNADTSLDYSKQVFNLAGQRVEKDYHGIVIQNGKKFKK